MSSGKIKIAVGIGILGAIVLLGYRFILVPRLVDTDGSDIPARDVSVALASVGALSAQKDPLSVVGVVQSQSEVVVRAETQGRIMRVLAEEGRRVSSGSVLAELENTALRAAVRQAEARVSSAEAGLSISEIQIENAEALLAEARESARNTIRSAFATADSAIHNNVDQFFHNPQSAQPDLAFSPYSSQLGINAELARRDIEQSLREWNARIENPENTPSVLIDDAQARLTEIRDFLALAADLTSRLTASATLSQATIDGWKSAVASARANINSVVGSISNVRDTLTNRETALEVARKQGAGDSSEEVLQSRAALLEAQAALDTARANLEKTIIRAPIAGTVNDLLVERGDFVNAFEDIAQIANNQALEIVTSITERDRSGVQVGSRVVLPGNRSGRVIEIAPTLDTQTKKIEVTIGIAGDASSFVNGASVALLIERTGALSANRADILIPVSALKVGARETQVFVVEDGRLVAVPVVLGPIVGGDVIVREGLTVEMEIVRDARGLREGQEVVIDEQ